jgi:hypothetical protein
MDVKGGLRLWVVHVVKLCSAFSTCFRLSFLSRSLRLLPIPRGSTVPRLTLTPS